MSTLHKVLLALVLLVAAFLRFADGGAGLDGERFFDERYSVNNLRRALDPQATAPANYYYPALSYLPQLAIARWSGESWFEGRQLTPAGYRQARSVSTIFGLLSILFTFMLGRHLWSSSVGLLAATVVTAAPLHLRLSVMWKPDALLLASILGVVLLTLHALENRSRPSLRRYAWVGLAVGTALSSKLNGGAAALPIAAFGLFYAHRDRRHILGVALAALLAAAVFLAIHSDPRPYFDALAENQEIYASQTEAGAGAGKALLDAGTVLLGPEFLGPVVGLSGAAGLILLFSPSGPAKSRRDLSVALSFPVLYLAIYLATTQYSKANNLLPLLPFVGLCAAVAWSEGWKRLLNSRSGSLGGRPMKAATAVAALALAVWLLAPATKLVYENVVPTTLDLAFDSAFESVPGLEGRVLVFEERPRRVALLQRQQREALRVGLEDWNNVALDRADVEILNASPERASFYEQRINRNRAATVTRITSGFGRARGPEQVVIAHPWPHLASQNATFVARGVETSGERSYVTTIPTAIRNDLVALVSFEFLLPHALSPAGELTASITIGGESRTGLMIRDRKTQTRYLSHRQPPCASEACDVVITFEGATASTLPARVDVTAHYWAGR